MHLQQAIKAALDEHVTEEREYFQGMLGEVQSNQERQHGQFLATQQQVLESLKKFAVRYNERLVAIEQRLAELCKRTHAIENSHASIERLTSLLELMLKVLQEGKTLEDTRRRE